MPLIFSIYRSASEKSKDQGGASSEARTAHKRKRQGEDDQALGGKGQGWGATLQHVNLFSDAEREAGKILGQNADHQREKKEQELRTQQRSGLAPTALGEGSAELKDKDAQPWYTQPQPSSRGQEVVARTVRLGREVTGQEAEEAIRRDQGRKGQADPMGSLFRSGAQTGDKAGNLLLPQASTTELLGAAGAEFGQAAERSDGKEPRGKNKKTKKGKREKKEKKQKRRKSKDRRRGGHSQDDSSKEHPAGEDEARDDRHAAMVRTSFPLAKPFTKNGGKKSQLARVGPSRSLNN